MSDADTLAPGVLRLAKTMDADPSDLAFLADLPAADLEALRGRVADALFRADKALFLRVAALAKTVPGSVAARLSETVLPPLLAARTAEVIEPARAVDLVGRLSDAYLADVSVALDATRAPEVVAAIPADKVAAIGAELARREEWVVIGGFVSHVDESTLQTALAGYDGAQLLRIGFVMDDLDRLDVVVARLRDDQVDAILAAAAGEGLWAEFEVLLDHLGAARRQRLLDHFEAAPAAVKQTFEAGAPSDVLARLRG